MTTEAAERLYQAQHLFEMQGKRIVIHNPQNKPIDELPVIYGFNNGGSSGWYSAVLMAEDGTCLGDHACSAECYMPYDLGILEGTRPDRHETFREHYPDGYQMEFVSFEAAKTHEKLQAAFKLNEAQAKAAEAP